MVDPQNPPTDAYATPATDETPTQDQDPRFEGIKIEKVEKDGNRLLVTVRADDPGKAGSPAAKDLAWNTRLEYGFGHSGIEAYGGPFVTDEERKKAIEESRRPEFWLQIFRLTPRL
jgi:hypothetical protein